MKPVDEIRAHYNQSPETEWKRIENRPEFLISCRFMARYIQKGDRILDIGGGPGRYAHLAKQGCHVTPLDLSRKMSVLPPPRRKNRAYHYGCGRHGSGGYFG